MTNDLSNHFAGCALTVQTTVMCDLVGIENVARAQAFVLVFTGVGSLIGVPLAGKRNTSN